MVVLLKLIPPWLINQGGLSDVVINSDTNGASLNEIKLPISFSKRLLVVGSLTYGVRSGMSFTLEALSTTSFIFRAISHDSSNVGSQLFYLALGIIL